MPSLRASSLLKATSVLAFLLVTTSVLYWSHLTNRLPTQLANHFPAFLPSIPSFQTSDTYTANDSWPHQIWQTTKWPYTSLDGEDREGAQTWDALNPSYTHEYMTDDKMEAYVREHFHDAQPDIEALYLDVQDTIVRSNLIRYLILLDSGGVYSDIDVSCLRPVANWLPTEYADNEEAGVVLGVDIDNNRGPDGRTPDGELLFELVNWTIMSKPNQPFLWFLILRVVENLRSMASLRGLPLSQIAFSQLDVQDATGPAALTKAFFDYARSATAAHVDYRNLTKLTSPQRFGEVVVLPIWAFGAEDQVKWAGWEEGVGEPLVRHKLKGGWREDHNNLGEGKGGASVKGAEEVADGEEGQGLAENYQELVEGGLDPEKALEGAMSGTSEVTNIDAAKDAKSDAAGEADSGAPGEVEIAAANGIESLGGESSVATPAEFTNAASDGTPSKGTPVNGTAVTNGTVAANPTHTLMKAPEPSLPLSPG